MTSSNDSSQDISNMTIESRNLTKNDNGTLSSCTILDSKPTEQVNSVVKKTTYTDSSGKLLTKTTTTRTLKTTTVRRVCVVAQKPDDQQQTDKLENAFSSFENSQNVNPNTSSIQFTKITNKNDSNSPNITGLAFMTPMTSETVTVENLADNPEIEMTEPNNTGDSIQSPKKTTRTVRKQITTSVAAVFTSLQGKFDGNHLPDPSHVNDSTDQELIGDTNAKHANALMALRDCERQFAENFSFALTKNKADDGVCISENINKSEHSSEMICPYLSLFSGLPLYQGYGLIGQKVSNEVDCNTQSVNDVKPLILNQSVPLHSNDSDVSTLTKMLEEITGSSLLKSDFDSFFGKIDQNVSPHNNNYSGVVINEIEDDSPKKATEVNNHTGLEYVTRNNTCETETISSNDNGNLNENQPYRYNNQFIHQIRDKCGPWRVAWTEMPEVQAKINLATMTNYEIQLQEAMFEVITSEASYYQSLQVLINCFYRAPEFECSKVSMYDSEPSIVEDSIENNCLESKPTTIGLKKTQSMSLKERNSITSKPLRNTTNESITSQSSSSMNTGNLPKPVISPVEKHHLFSNVLLVCLASERFLRDLEQRWASQRPVLTEVCDLIVKHAGSECFEPYVTYLKNQNYQIAALRHLNQKEEFQNALDRLHSQVEVGKNRIDSFLALPMQRLTRLKLLVEVIQKLQNAVLKESEEKALSGSTETMTSNQGFIKESKISSDQKKNVCIALKQLQHLLAESEMQKMRMDQKARLFTLSNSLEFVDSIKRISISDKVLLKEGELKSITADGKTNSFLKKVGFRKPESVYLILFNDLLMVTKRKRNEKYLVLDYCPSNKLHVNIGPPVDVSLTLPNSFIQSNVIPRSLNVGIPAYNFKRPAVLRNSQKVSKQQQKSPEPSTVGISLTEDDLIQDDLMNTTELNSPVTLSPLLKQSKSVMSGLHRSDSSASSKSASSSNEAFSTSKGNQVFLNIILTGSHTGTCTELCLSVHDSAQFDDWYQVLSSTSTESE